jgi:hypothetical protein
MVVNFSELLSSASRLIFVLFFTSMKEGKAAEEDSWPEAIITGKREEDGNGGWSLLGWCCQFLGWKRDDCQKLPSFGGEVWFSQYLYKNPTRPFFPIIDARKPTCDVYSRAGHSGQVGGKGRCYKGGTVSINLICAWFEVKDKHGFRWKSIQLLNFLSYVKGRLLAAWTKKRTGLDCSKVGAMASNFTPDMNVFLLRYMFNFNIQSSYKCAKFTFFSDLILNRDILKDTSRE